MGCECWSFDATESVNVDIERILVALFISSKGYQYQLRVHPPP